MFVNLINRARSVFRKATSHLPLAIRRPLYLVLHIVKRAAQLLVHPKKILRGVAQELTFVRLADQISRWILIIVAFSYARFATRLRLSLGRTRSLWGVTPILTLPLKAKADRLLGIRSESLVFVTYTISSDFNFNVQKIHAAIVKYAPGFLTPATRLLLAWAICRYDIFHYFYDRGLMNPQTRFGVHPEELNILRTAGKRVFLFAYGADVRRRPETLKLGHWNFCKECPEPGRYCVCDEEPGKRLMEQMCASVTQPLALGDMLAYVPRVRNLHYWPIDLDRVSLATPPSTSGVLRIAHAPNHAHFKGTRYLEAVIEKLQDNGYSIEYVKVQGVPNEQVIRLFGEADLIVDQFIGGAYGYTALEAMARGKPVLTYVRSPDLVEAVNECPLINVNPETLEEVLLWILNNRDSLPAIGAQGRAYVEKWHSISAVADRFGRIYEEKGNFPELVLRRIRAHRTVEMHRKGEIKSAQNWEHPFRV